MSVKIDFVESVIRTITVEDVNEEEAVHIASALISNDTLTICRAPEIGRSFSIRAITPVEDTPKRSECHACGMSGRKEKYAQLDGGEVIEFSLICAICKGFGYLWQKSEKCSKDKC